MNIEETMNKVDNLLTDRGLTKASSTTDVVTPLQRHRHLSLHEAGREERCRILVPEIQEFLHAPKLLKRAKKTAGKEKSPL